MRPSIATLVAATAAIAPGAGAQDFRAEPRLVAESPVARPGHTVWIAIDFTLDDGWHTYWPGINDSGIALDVVIEHPEHAEPGDLLWPAPHRYSPAEGILDHVFEEHMTVLLPVDVSPDAALGGTVRLDLDMRWMVCENACILESATRSIEIPIADAAAKPSPETAALFAAARARLPKPATGPGAPEIHFSGGSLALVSNGASSLAFYPEEDSRPPRDLLRQGQREGDTLVLEFREGDEPITGVLEVWSSPKKSEVYAIRWPQTAEQPDPPAGAARRADN